MEHLKKWLLIFFFAYAGICLLLFFVQEKLLFFPAKLPPDHSFRFSETFEEIQLETSDGLYLNSLWFEPDSIRGMVLFLHGNAGSIDSWARDAGLFVQLGYAVLYLDYRGFGKSQGNIQSEQQLLADAQLAFDWLKKRQPKTPILLSGTSLGSGIATKIAAENQVDKLFLNSPYYGLEQLIREKYPPIPPFVIKYKLPTHEYIRKVACPIFVFHGDQDQLIPYDHSLRLQRIRPDLDLHIIEGCGHNDLLSSSAFQEQMKSLLKP